MMNRITSFSCFLIIIQLAFTGLYAKPTDGCRNLDERMNSETTKFIETYLKKFKTKSADTNFWIEFYTANYVNHNKAYPQYYKEVEKVTINAVGTETNGNYTVPMTAFVPIDYEKSTTIFVFLHGGSFIYGDLMQYTPVLTHLAGALKSIFIFVDYRKAPMAPFPYGSNDCLVATEYIVANKDNLFKNLQGSKVALFSNSAGGNYAAYVANTLTKSKIAYHITYCPVISLKPEDLTGGSIDEFIDDQYYVPMVVPFVKAFYLYPAVYKYGLDIYNSTQFCPFLGVTKDSPKVQIFAAQLDPLLDQSIFVYKNALKKNKVKHELRMINGTIHGFFEFIGFFPTAFQQSFREVRNYILTN